MTTRRKAAKPNPEMGIYPDDDYDEADSRRTSLDEISVTTPISGYGSEPPTKRQRTADPSPQQSAVSFYDQEDHSMNGEKASSGLFDERHQVHQVASGSQSSSGGALAPAVDFDASQPSVERHLTNNKGVAQDQVATADDSMGEDGSEHDHSGYEADETQLSQTQQDYDETNGTLVEDEGTGHYTHYEPLKSHRQMDEVYQSGEEGDWVEAVNPLPSTRDLESREVSVESSRSDVPAMRELPLPEVSTDATPMATRQGSPATTASAAAEELTPARSKPAVDVELTGYDDEDDDEEVDDVEPATEIQDTMENMEEEVEVTRYAEDYEEDDAPVRKTTKRRFAGGRRRAAHSNAYVEAALRRQLELKQFYRQVTRSMKACLGELAQITLDELETDQQHHAQVTEYESVIAELDEQLARRKQQLLSAQKFNHEQLLQRYDAESDSRRNRCRNYLEDIKEQQLINLEYNMLQVNRAKLREEPKPGHETEDEDGVIPRPKRMGYRFKRSNPIDQRYDSRSRFTLETERSIDDLQRRTNMWEALRAYAPDAVEAFTVMDSAARDAADERKRNVGITSNLANAATEFERMYNAPNPPQAPPLLTAEELAPLNALAELAVKPALRSQRQNGRTIQPSPRQARSPLPSQSFFERSTGAAPPHQSSFLRLAMEQPRNPPHHTLGHSPMSAMLSGLRKSEDASSASSTAAARSSDGRQPIAAKPASHSQESNGRPQPGHSHSHQPTEQQIHEIMSGMPTIHPDRGRLMALELASKLNAQPANQPASHPFAGQQNSSTNSDSQSEAVNIPVKCHQRQFANSELQSRHAFSLPPHQSAARSASTAGSEIKSEHDAERLSRKPSAHSAEHLWKGPVTSRSDREGASRRQSGLRTRAKRHREDDPSEGVRNQRLRAATASLESQRRPRSSNASETEEERLRARLAQMSPRSRRIAGIVDDEVTRNNAASSDLSDRGRRLSSQSYRGRRPSFGAPSAGLNRRASDNHRPPPFQQGPPPPPPGFPPPFMHGSGWPNGSFYGQPPMPAPTAQPINHFAAMSQGFGGASWGQGPFQPGANPGPPPPFRDFYGRR